MCSYARLPLKTHAEMATDAGSQCCQCMRTDADTNTDAHTGTDTDSTAAGAKLKDSTWTAHGQQMAK